MTKCVTTVLRDTFAQMNPVRKVRINEMAPFMFSSRSPKTFSLRKEVALPSLEALFRAAGRGAFQFAPHSAGGLGQARGARSQGGNSALTYTCFPLFITQTVRVTERKLECSGQSDLQSIR